MSNINLYQSIERSEQEGKKRFMLSGSFFWSLGLLLLSMALLGGAKFVSQNLKEKQDLLAEEIAQQNANFGGGDLNRIVDFQARLDESSKNIEEKSRFNTNKALFAIEDSMVKGVAAISLAYAREGGSGQSIAIGMSADNFSVIAKQILSFKENKSFTNISVQEIMRDEKGISFKIKANLK